jgi:hypothetical protein
MFYINYLKRNWMEILKVIGCWLIVLTLPIWIIPATVIVLSYFTLFIPGVEWVKGSLNPES